MLSDFDNPRPLPPAKVRRATSKADPLNCTPPPAYGSTFVFPSRHNSSSEFGTDILNTPTESTHRLMTAWDNESPLPSFAEDPGAMEWMNETSREELHELLLKAQGIIKEREQELGLATNNVKRVYDHNVVLKSKHEALFAKIPMSPSLSHSPSPEPTSKSTHFSHSASESILPDPLKTRARKISIAMADISLLADQNAELLSKLQKLEEDATAADIAGRRDLKRLEKEIVYLRDALEKTQAKSEELEGKVQNAVASEAVRRRKEREEIRNAARNNMTEATVLDFAPPGSKFGGPSDRCSLLDLPKEENHIRSGLEPSSSSVLDSSDEVVSDQVLIARLLDKVKELEEANARILHQQVETANQLAHVQQDAMNMTKVYELLSDHDAVQLELESEEGSVTKGLPVTEDRSEIPTIRFRSLRRNIEDSMSENGSFVFPEKTHGTKPRKTVLGLFDEQDGSGTKDEAKASTYRRPLAEFLGGASGTSTISSATSSSAGPLSPLYFFSPVLQSDPHSQGRTLQNELESMFGQGVWNLSGPNHMRTASLSNLSQFSDPSTPSPTPGSLSYLSSDEREVRTPTPTQSECDAGLQTIKRTSEFPADNSLRLSVEPPTPDSDMRAIATQKRTSRLQNMSRTLRSRKGRWIERTSYDGASQQAKCRDTLAPSVKPKGSAAGLPQQMSNAVDDMMDNFRALSSHSADDPEGGGSSSQITALRAQRGAECGLDEDAQNIVRKRHEDQVTANKSFLLQAWLWFQFAIVVLIFIFSMARKGPSVVLGGAEGSRKEKRAVARR